MISITLLIFIYDFTIFIIDIYIYTYVTYIIIKLICKVRVRSCCPETFCEKMFLKMSRVSLTLFKNRLGQSFFHVHLAKFLRTPLAAALERVRAKRFSCASKLGFFN